MSLRISSALGCLALLAGCGSESPPPPGDQVECAVGAGADYSPVCTLEKVAASGELVLHHPDGGFRRLIRNPATGALVPVDGAEPLIPEDTGEGAVQFAVGADRYRIPRTLLDPPSS
ncbi:hypothetical protein [Erythrobacter dokdonensis]|uniref:Putative lipoprotein n=1 Tax=Erythrobacter dokdonensis DSW-74 TaxID=1300349 RepID=A0A1A7BJ17_9SPHN|nr:hypothetical protein [Erythrobacter dokdonensis]OBV12464.1 putative lipoprotein [Erythrobacter dokdonensis DSW-74]